jgi:hypothetical protein
MSLKCSSADRREISKLTINSHEVTAQYNPDFAGTIFIFNLFGVVLVLNLEEQPPLELNEMITLAGFDYCAV